jgi:hypothetical protein
MARKYCAYWEKCWMLRTFWGRYGKELFRVKLLLMWLSNFSIAPQTKTLKLRYEQEQERKGTKKEGRQGWYKLRELRGRKKVKLINILVSIKCLLYEDAVNWHLLGTWFEFAVDLLFMTTRTFDILCRF